MNIWEILGIEKTEDESEIRDAYAEKLKIHHPEEDPEGFQSLREAYELALKGEEFEEEEITEFTIFVDKAKEIYENFSRRADVESWRELLQDDIVNRIDTEEEALIGLLGYLADNFQLPKSVWVLLLDHFGIKDRKEELSHFIPEDFLTYIINWQVYDDLIRYEEFDINPDIPAETYEQYLSVGQEIHRLLLEYRGEESQQEITDRFAEIDAFGIYNVDVEIFRCRYYYLLEKYDEATELATELNKKSNGDYKVLNALGQVYMVLEKYDDAIDVFEKTLEIYPGYGSAEAGIAYSNLKKGNFVEAKTLYYEIIKKTSFDAYITERYTEVNEALIPYYEEVLEKNEPYFEEGKELTIPAIKLKLASCYFNSQKGEECRDILESFEPDEEIVGTYVSMIIDIYSILENPEKVIETFGKWVDNENLKEDRGNFFGRYAEALKDLDREEEALKIALKEIDNYPEEILLYTLVASLYEEKEEYEESAKILKKGLKNVSDPLRILIMLAETEYKLNNFGSALDYADEATDIYPYIPSIFETRIKIFYYADHNEDVLRIAKEFEMFEMKKPDIEFYKGSALRQMYRFDESIEVFDEMIKENPDDSRVYYELAIAYDNLEKFDDGIKNVIKYIEMEPDHVGAKMVLARFHRKKKEFDEAIKQFDEIIKDNPENPIARMELGLVYKDWDKNDEAEVHMKKAIEVDKTSPYAYRELAELYMDNKQYKEAIEIYTSFLMDIGEDPEIFVLRGIAHSRLKDFEQQIADYEKAIEIDPEFAWPYNNLGYSYYVAHDYDKAIHYYKIAMEKDPAFLNPCKFLAESFFESHQYEQGFEVLDEGIENDEFSFDSKIELMSRKQDVLTDLGRFDELIEYVKECLEKYPDVRIFHNMHMLSMMYVGKIDEAISIGQEAISTYPTSESLIANLADVYRSGRKSYKKAVEYYTKAIELYNHYADAIFFRGIAYLKIGEKDKAKKDFLEAKIGFEERVKNNIENDYHENEANYVKLGRIAFHLGNIKEAKEYLQKAKDNALKGIEFFFMITDSIYYLEYEIYKYENNQAEALASIDKAIELFPSFNYKTERELFLKGEDDSQISYFNKIKNIFKNKD